MSSRTTWSSTKYTEYMYDAAGNKLRTIHKNGSTTKTTDYCGSVIYENGVLKRILTEEGYITLLGTTPTYYYYLKDHLGNNRVVINSSGTVQQTTHYYPFGGSFASTGATVQPYKFGAKELDDNTQWHDSKHGFMMICWAGLRRWIRWRRSIIVLVRMRIEIIIR